MRLLLTHGFFLNEDSKEQQVMRPYPPLGILYISAYLRSRGFDVDVYDSTWGSREELFRILDQGPPAMLGLYANLLTRRNALAIIERARATGWKVIVGGPEPANYADEYLLAGADYVVPGEGELVIEQLLLGDERQLARNLARQLAVYATGAPIHFSDRAPIEQILDRAKASHYGVRSLVHELVQSELFLNK